MLRNLTLLIASYIFYGWWDARFLTLIIFSTLVDYTLSRLIFNNTVEKERKFLLFLSLFINLGLLFYFKYYNFFITEFVESFLSVGINLDVSSLKIILPVGISFYTFQTLSYTIDVYRGKMAAENNFLNVATFIAFFPQLVAGPIERATNLLPQFKVNKRFKYEDGVEGLKQILWGLFKKMVIADNCAVYVNDIFGNYTEYNSISLILGAFFFTFQIYCDFSGYSDIAIGTARLFGFKLSINFKYPYFSRDIAEFWRRWHISLSTWFRDYLYIPLGGSRGGVSSKVKNTFIIFVVSGFWHGANWTFIFWGFLNALYFLPLLLSNKNRENVNTDVGEGDLKSNFNDFFSILKTFILTNIAWVFFRADSLTQAFDYLFKIVNSFSFNFPNYYSKKFSVILIVLIIMTTIFEFKKRKLLFPLEKHFFRNKYLRIITYIIIFSLLGLFSYNEKTNFIYFQF